MNLREFKMIKTVITVLSSVVITLAALFCLRFVGVDVANLLGIEKNSHVEQTIASDISYVSNLAEINAQIPVEGLIIPINTPRRQSLLMLDFYLFTPEDNEKKVIEDIPKIKNRLLKTFSVKPVEYYRDEAFILNLQEDLRYFFQKENRWGVNEVLVTKAVYQ